MTRLIILTIQQISVIHQFLRSPLIITFNIGNRVTNHLVKLIICQQQFFTNLSNLKARHCKCYTILYTAKNEGENFCSFCKFLALP